MKKLIFLTLTSVISLNVTAQDAPQGYFASEASTLAIGENIAVSIKQYNPSQEEIKQASHPKANAPMNFLQVPFIVTNASLFNNGFESVLYCLDKTGRLKWQRPLGFSKYSGASPLAEDSGFLYAGEGMREDGKIQIQKFDSNGRVVWSKILDSLQAVNSINISGKMLNALVSFDANRKVDHAGKTFSYEAYPVYFFLQLNIQTGDVIRKEYQMMGNYMSSLGFANPYVNSYASYYLSKKDSAVFFSVDNQKSANVVSEDLPRENSILTLTAGPSENHYLTIANGDRSTAAYVLFSDFYGAKKKYASKLDVKPGLDGYDRCYLLQTKDDIMISVIVKDRVANVCYTDKDGKSSCTGKKGILTSTVVGAGLYKEQPYFIEVEGRDKPGGIGTIKLVSY